MKIFKFLAILTVSVLLFTGCADDDITNYAFADVSAPSDVSADFDITQDDTGTVTITPSGEGAQMFEVYFGDTDNETPTEIAAGENVTHVYNEGEYVVKIVAIGSTGLTSEFNQTLVVSFKAPENMVIAIDQPDSNPKKITVTPSADFATLFEVYFGDVENEEPVVVMPGESIEHTYEPGVYEITVIAKGAGVATTEEDAIVIIPEATDPLKLPITFDMGTVSYAFATFGGASFEVVMNPDLSGANPDESNVGAITNSGAEWEGGSFNLGESVDFSGDDKQITVKMWSDVEISLLMKFEGGIDDARANEVKVTHGGTGWEELTFNFATNATKSFIDGNQGVGEAFVPTGQYEILTLFIDGGGFTAGTFYIDDIAQPSALPNCIPETEENIDAANGPIFWTFMTDDEDYEFDQFGNIETDIVGNPKTDGINSSCRVQKIIKTDPCETWSGIGQELQTAIDFSATDKKVFTMKVLAETQASEVTLRLERLPHPDVDPAYDRVATITEVGEWQLLTFDFSDVSEGTFKSMIIYFERNANCDGDVYYFDEIKQIAPVPATCVAETEENIDAANGPIKWTFMNDDPDHEFDQFGNLETDIVDNPSIDVFNSSCKVQKVIKTDPCETWSGLGQELPTAIDFSATDKKRFKMKVYAETQVTEVTLRLERLPHPDVEPAYDRVASITKVGEWQELTFDFSDVSDDTFKSMIIYFERGANCDGDIYYFDDIVQF